MMQYHVHKTSLKRFRILIVFSMLLGGAMSCTKLADGPEPAQSEKIGKGFYVLNQGNYTAGNASLSFFNYDSAKMQHHLFYQKNGIPLGDVGQSITIWNQYAYIVVNNSGIIWVVNKDSGLISAKLSGLQSPRYMQIISSEKAYVSDFYYKGITVFHPGTLQLLGTINTGKTTENLLYFEDKVFVTNWSQFNQTSENNTIQVIDVLSDQLIDSIVLVKEPNSMVIDKFNRLWVLCSGGFMEEETPALFQINTLTHEVEQRFDFASAMMSPNQLVINSDRDTLFFINQDIYMMPVASETLPTMPMIIKGNRNFYALEYDPVLKQILVSDAGNYMQQGHIYRFRCDGTLIDSLQAGIIPGSFAFN